YLCVQSNLCSSICLIQYYPNHRHRHSFPTRRSSDLYHTGGTQYYQVNAHKHRMYEEFVKIEKVIREQNTIFATRQLEHSIHVLDVLEQALTSANLSIGPSIK